MILLGVPFAGEKDLLCRLPLRDVHIAAPKAQARYDTRTLKMHLASYMSASASASPSRALRRIHFHTSASVSARRYTQHVATLRGRSLQLCSLPPNSFRIQLASLPLRTHFRHRPSRI